jgi:hypothetical protein
MGSTLEEIQVKNNLNNYYIEIYLSIMKLLLMNQMRNLLKIKLVPSNNFQLFVSLSLEMHQEKELIKYFSQLKQILKKLVKIFQI